MPISFGSKLSWVAQLAVMPFRRSPARLPMMYSPLGIFHSTRRRSLSYSSGSTSGGKGPIGSPVAPATVAESTGAEPPLLTRFDWFWPAMGALLVVSVLMAVLVLIAYNRA